MTKKPSINWDHVAPEFKWLCEDEGGFPKLAAHEPQPIGAPYNYWETAEDTVWIDARYFASYSPGTCRWIDSNVERPEGHDD